MIFIVGLQICTHNGLISFNPVNKEKCTKKIAYYYTPDESLLAPAVEKVLQDAGLRPTSDPGRSSLVWAALYNSSLLMYDYAKISQVPNHRAFTLKNRFAQMMNADPLSESVIPKTFVVPDDLSEFFTDQADYDGYYVLKAGAGARGESVQLFKNLSEIQLQNDSVIQRYLIDPLLLNKHKFDVRFYLFINQNGIFLYNQSIIRTASTQYNNPNLDNQNERRMHLTNVAVNGIKNVGRDMMTKMMFFDLQKWFTDKQMEKMMENAERTLIIAFQQITKKVNIHSNQSFGLYGADVIFDDQMNAKLLEINLMPAMGVRSPVDEFKYQLLKDTFQLAGISSGNGQQNVSAEGREGGFKKLLVVK